MGLRIEQRRGVTVLHITGDLTGGEEAPRLKQEIDRLVAAAKIHLLVDLTEVGLVSSLGIGLLCCCLTRVRRHGGELKLTGASARVRRALEVCRLLDVFEHYDDREEAVRSYDSLPA